MANLGLAILKKRARELKDRVHTRAFLTQRYGTEFDSKGRARCPCSERHNNGDTKPSFTVDDNGSCQCWSQHCFGDDPTDVFGVIREKDGVGFAEAVQIVSDHAGERVNGNGVLPQSVRPPASTSTVVRRTVSPGGQGKLAAEYVYADRHGNDVLMVRRFEYDGGKSFAQFSPDGEGGWVTGAKGIKAPLYRLPELIEGDDPIVVVEGEKCADALREIGVNATTCAGGASKFTQEHAEQLQGREVVVWPDNDKPGRRHGDQVCRLLESTVAALRRVELPDYLSEGGDVVDVQEAKGEAEVHRLIAAAPANGTADRPSIYAGAADLAATVDAAWQAILAYNDPIRLMRLGSALVVVGEADGEIVVVPQSADAIRVRLARAARWFSVKQQKGERVEYDSYPPDAVVRGLIAGDISGVPLLRRLVRAPIMTPSGRIVDSEGYDAETHTWHAASCNLSPISARPTEAEIRAARELCIGELLGDFPFVDEADRANALALLLLPLARELIDGPTPLHLVEKPSPGSGASLLLETIGVLVRGSAPSLLTEARDEDEWRKRITSTLLGAPEIVIIDNLRRPLDSAALSAVLTARTWEDRRLGSSSNVSLPVRCVWAATGNNPAVSSEIARRSVSIRIDSKTERPWERTKFRHPDLTAWTLEHRAQLLGAALTLLRAWDAGGRPQGEASLGSYEHWSAVMGGILDVAGVDGFLANKVRFYDRADREIAAWSTFIGVWWDRCGSTEVGTRDLWALLENVDPPCDLGRGSDRSQRTRFGEVLAGAVDRCFAVNGNRVRLEGAGTRQRAAQYRLTPGE